jgi:hypothetical protein
MRFNLNDYETVESRIRKFHELHDDGRIVTEWDNMDGYIDQQTPNTWVVKAYVYLTAGDQANGLPKATGYAFEIDGTGGANQTSALENAETSAIGRALANMALSGNKRASREEMSKVVAGARNFLMEASVLDSKESLRLLWAEAKAARASEEVLEEIKGLANGIGATSVNTGAATGVPGSDTKAAQGKGTKPSAP